MDNQEQEIVKCATFTEEARKEHEFVRVSKELFKQIRQERDQWLALAAKLRAALGKGTAACIEEGDLRLLMSSLSGRALDEADIEFTRRYGAGLAAAREALAATPAEALEEMRESFRREFLEWLQRPVSELQTSDPAAYLIVSGLIDKVREQAGAERAARELRAFADNPLLESSARNFALDRAFELDREAKCAK